MNTLERFDQLILRLVKSPQTTHCRRDVAYYLKKIHQIWIWIQHLCQIWIWIGWIGSTKRTWPSELVSVFLGIIFNICTFNKCRHYNSKFSIQRMEIYSLHIQNKVCFRLAASFSEINSFWYFLALMDGFTTASLTLRAEKTSILVGVGNRTETVEPWN